MWLKSKTLRVVAFHLKELLEVKCAVDFSIQTSTVVPSTVSKREKKQMLQ